MSSTRNNFFSEINYSLIVKILQHAQTQGWQINKACISAISSYQNQISNDAEKSAHLNNILAISIASENTSYHSSYKSLLNDFFEEGIQAIFAEAARNNGEMNESQINTIKHYHQSLRNRTDEQIIFQYSRICDAYINTRNNVYKDLHHDLFILYEDLLKNVVDQLYPEAAANLQLIKSSSSPAA